MKIGFYVAVVSRRRGEENNVSGHIQIALHSIKLLREAGHDVHLITHKYGPERSMPACLPAQVPLHLLDDARIRGGNFDPTHGEKSRTSIRKLLKHIRDVKEIARSERFDILHVFGFQLTAVFAGFLKLCNVGCPVIVTLYSPPTSSMRLFKKLLFRQVDGTITATQYVQRCAKSFGLTSALVRHGVVKSLASGVKRGPHSAKSRVLFWREATLLNGGDLCLSAFEKLAPEFPEVQFDMAIRKHWKEVPGVDELADRHHNVNVYRFPYEPGITLEKLVSESIAIILPFRRLTIHPQLAVAESLEAGVAVVTTQIESMDELITTGRNGIMIPPNDAGEIVDAVRMLLSNRERTLEIGQQASTDFAATWNWSHYVDAIEQVYRTARNPSVTIQARTKLSDDLGVDVSVTEQAVKES